MPSPMILLWSRYGTPATRRSTSRRINAAVVTDQGNQSDDAAAARDYDRYLAAYPDLAGHGRPLEVEMKIPPGASQQGTVLISPSVTKEQFDARKDSTVTIEPYDQRTIVLHEKAAARSR